MLPRDEKILKALELVIPLYTSKQLFSGNLPDEEKAILTVSKQLILSSGLTIMEFVYSLRQLSEKGYTQHFIIFDDHARAKLDEALQNQQLESEFKKVEQLDTPEMSEKIKNKAIESFSKIANKGNELTLEDVKDENFKLSDAAKDGINLYKRLRPDEIGLVLILPFRNLERLQEKMQNGMKFTEVQDVNIWYDSKNFKLHVGKTIFNASNRGSRTRVHYILDAIFNKDRQDKLILDYSSVEHFNYAGGVAKENKRHYLSMRTFLKTNGKLRDIFYNYSDRLEINPAYISDIN